MPQWFSTRCPAAATSNAISVVSSPFCGLVAVIRKQGTVSLVNDQGECVLEGIKLAWEGLLASWCPTSAVLAIGGSAGQLALVSVLQLAVQPDPAAAAKGAPPTPFTVQLLDVKSPHTGSSTLIRWTPDGARLISGDSTGGVALWKVEIGGGGGSGSCKVTQAAVLKRSGSIMDAAVLTYPGAPPLPLPPSGLPPAPSLAACVEEDLPPLPPLAGPGSASCAFLFGSDNGAVTYLDESGRTVDVLPGLHSPVDSLEFVLSQEHSGLEAAHEHGVMAGRMVIATRALLLVQVGVYGDGRLVPLSRSKVSVRAGGSLRARACVPTAGIVASVCPEEAGVRCWDVAGPLDEPDNYTLSSTIAGRAIAKAERPAAIAFTGKGAGVLAVGTDSGHVYLWRQPSGAQGRAAVWEPLATVGTGSGIDSLSWGCSEEGQWSLSARLATGEVAILREALLRRRIAPPILAMQLSSHEVCVERVPPDDTGSALPWPLAIRTLAPIRGLTATPKAVLVWSGGEVSVYTVPDSIAAYSALKSSAGGGGAGSRPDSAHLSVPLLKASHTFKASGEPTLAQDAVLAIDGPGRALLVHNLSGVVKATLPIPLVDGAPVLLDASANGRYVCVATDSGRLRVYDFGRADPVIVGTGVFEAVPGPGEDPVPLGVIAGIRVSADGSRVAVLATRSSDLPLVPSARAMAEMAAAAAEKEREVASHGKKQPVGSSGGLYKAVTLASGRADVVVSSATSSGKAEWSGAGQRVSLPAVASVSSVSSVVVPDSRLYVYSFDTDRTCWWEFGPDRRPVEIAWDVSEPKLLCVQVERKPDGEGGAGGRRKGFGFTSSSKPLLSAAEPEPNEGWEEGGGRSSDREIVTLWTAPEGVALAAGVDARVNGGEDDSGPGAPVGVSDALVLADSMPLEAPCDALLGLAAPHVATLLLPSAVSAGASRVSLMLLRDFAGLESVGGASLARGLPSSLSVQSKDSSAGGSASVDSGSGADAARRALLEFSYHAACGNMDNAYAAVRSLLARLPGKGSAAAAAVWANLAASCVRSQRLDVAAVCLGHMGHARGAKAVREAGEAHGSDAGASAGVLAVQLGRLPEAAKAFQSAGRFDLLSGLYADSGSWGKAASTARIHDRIHVKRLSHAQGRHLESTGSIEGAIAAYELAGAGAREVPRLLVEARDWRALDAYCTDKWREGAAAREKAGVSGGPSVGGSSVWADSSSPSSGVSLSAWYGQWLEARGDPAGAMVWYERAQDAVSMVRMHMGRGDVAAAVAVAERSSAGQPAAAYALGRALEGVGDVHGALRMYGLSGRVGHAIRLAVASGMEQDVLPLAIQANDPRTQCEAAGVLEGIGGSGPLSRAAELYARAGALDRAVTVCLDHGLTDLLPSIVDAALGSEGEAGASSGPASPIKSPGKTGQSKKGVGIARSVAQAALLSKLAEHFLSRGQHARALDMLLRAGKAEAALELAVQHRLAITDEVAEAMTPAEVEGEGEAAEAARASRVAVLSKLAGALKKAGSYHMSAKKYTQAGDKVRALKALLASGDTEKIIFFAQVSRSKDIYILAANYLQSLPWHTDGEVLRTIIEFYTKAKAADALSAFYESCGTVEMDEYRNYEKAAAALKEALRQAGKIKEDSIRTARVASLQGRIAIVERFVAVRRAAKGDTEEMVAGCTDLLAMPDVETAIRVGDVFALLIYFYAQQQAWEKAASMVDAMQKRSIAVDPFVERELVVDIYTKAGRPEHVPGRSSQPAADGDGVEEDIRPT